MFIYYFSTIIPTKHFTGTTISVTKIFSIQKRKPLIIHYLPIVINILLDHTKTKCKDNKTMRSASLGTTRYWRRAVGVQARRRCVQYIALSYSNNG